VAKGKAIYGIGGKTMEKAMVIVNVKAVEKNTNE